MSNGMRQYFTKHPRLKVLAIVLGIVMAANACCYATDLPRIIFGNSGGEEKNVYERVEPTIPYQYWLGD